MGERNSSETSALDAALAGLCTAEVLKRRVRDGWKELPTARRRGLVGFVGLTLVPIAMGWPLVLMRIHIAFLHLLIDPACSVVSEAQPAEADVMQRPPRDPKAPMFGRRVIGLSSAQGVAVLLVVYSAALRMGQAVAEARALAFTTFLMANRGLIFTNRSWTRVIASSSLKDVTLWSVTGGAMVSSGLVIYVSPLARLFRFAPLGIADVVLCCGAAALSITWFEILKWRGRSRVTTTTKARGAVAGAGAG